MDIDSKIDKRVNAETLGNEAARSKIISAAYDHLRELGVRDVSAIEWGLDFDLHFGLGFEELAPINTRVVQ